MHDPVRELDRVLPADKSGVLGLGGQYRGVADVAGDNGVAVAAAVVQVEHAAGARLGRHPARVAACRHERHPCPVSGSPPESEVGVHASANGFLLRPPARLSQPLRLRNQRRSRARMRGTRMPGLGGELGTQRVAARLVAELGRRPTRIAEPGRAQLRGLGLVPGHPVRQR
jgi:hypothetical protein